MIPDVDALGIATAGGMAVHRLGERVPLFAEFAGPNPVVVETPTMRYFRTGMEAGSNMIGWRRTLSIGWRSR